MTTVIKVLSTETPCNTVASSFGNTKAVRLINTDTAAHEPPMKVIDKATGRKGTVRKSYKEPTFSRMVPLTPPLRQVKWDDDGSREERRDHTIRKVKEDAGQVSNSRQGRRSRLDGVITNGTV